MDLHLFWIKKGPGLYGPCSIYYHAQELLVLNSVTHLAAEMANVGATFSSLGLSLGQ